MGHNLTERKAACIAATVYLVLLCINPLYTQGHGQMNILLNVALCLSPIVLIMRKARTFIPRIDIPMTLVAALIIGMPLIFHPETVRWETQLFTCAYCFFFMMFARLVLISDFPVRAYFKIIEWIIYAYTIMLLIQQLCVLCGWPVLGETFHFPDLPWKLNSLHSESSHTIVTVSTLMYFYTQSQKNDDRKLTILQSIKGNPLLWGAFIWVSATSFSTSALVLGPLCFLPFINRHNILKWLAAAAVILIIALCTPLKDYRDVSRLRHTIAATVTLDDKKVMDADLSASARIVPTFRGARIIDPTDVRLLTGYGVDADDHDTAPRPCDIDKKGFAGVFSLMHNYGLFAALAFWIGIGMVTLVSRHPLSILTFIFAVQMSADYNMQLGWMIMAFSMIFKYSVCRSRKLLETFPRRDKN